MKKCLFLLFLFLNLNAYAEFAQVRDPDGYTHLRDKPNGKIIGKIPDKTYVYTPESDSESAKGGWIRAYDLRGKRAVEGVIHQSRLQAIHNYQKIPVRLTQEGFSCMKNGMGVRAAAGEFNYNQHKQWFGIKDKMHLTYHGRKIFGTDGDKPLTHFRQIAFVDNGKIQAVPSEKFDYLFNPYLKDKAEFNHDTGCFYRAADDTFFVTTVVGDGAAYSEVLFVFVRGKLTQVLASLHPEV